MLASLTKPGVVCELVVAGCDASPLCEPGEATFNVSSLFVGDPVIVALMLVESAQRYDRFTALYADQIA